MAYPGLVIGVDIGTTGVKVETVDAAAVSHAGAERDYPTETPTWTGPGRLAARAGLARGPPGSSGLGYEG